jgi:hypothetical protein
LDVAQPELGIEVLEAWKVYVPCVGIVGVKVATPSTAGVLYVPPSLAEGELARVMVPEKEVSR